MLCWDAPVTEADFGPGVDWADAIVPHWAFVVSWIDQVRHDALCAREWKAIVDQLDSAGEPTTPEGANRLLRRAVANVWASLERYEVRRRAAAAAALWRRLQRVGTPGLVIQGEDAERD